MNPKISKKSKLIIPILVIALLAAAAVLGLGWYWAKKVTLEVTPTQKSFKIDESVHLTLEFKKSRLGKILGAVEEKFVPAKIARAAEELNVEIKVYNPAGVETEVKSTVEQKENNQIKVTLDPPKVKSPHGNWQIEAKLQKGEENYEARQTFNWGGKEVMEKRDITSKTYDNLDGTFTLEAHTGPIHYKDRDTGKIDEIDTTLVDEDDKWVAEKNNYRARIPKAANRPMDFEDVFKDKNQTITMVPQTQAVEGKIETEQDGQIQWVRYPDAYGKNLDLRARAGNLGLYKEVIVKEKPQNPEKDLAFDFQIIPPPDKAIFKRDGQTQKLTPVSQIDGLEVTADNELAIGDKSGSEDSMSFIRKIRIWDASGAEISGKLRFFQKDGKIYFQKIIPAEFLKSASYPVSTDDVTFYTTSGDGYVEYAYNSSWPTVHNATDGTASSSTLTVTQLAVVGKSSGNFGIRRGFFPINTASIPANATINTASFYVYVSGKQNIYDDGYDWITIVKSSQASSSTLSNADYDAIDTTEKIDTGQRQDITGINFPVQISFAFNTSGKNSIIKSGQSSDCGGGTGYTCLGMRTGDDVLNHQFGYGGNGFNYIAGYYYENSANTPYLTVTYSYPIAQRAYIFQNDDSTSGVDNNTNMSSANTAVSSIAKGQRLTARFQIENNNASATGDVNYKVQYDRQGASGAWENRWSDVDFGGAESANSGGLSSGKSWHKSSIESGMNGNNFYASSLVVGADGYPTMLYNKNAVLTLAKCNNAVCSSVTKNTFNVLVKNDASMVIGVDDNPVIAYGDLTDDFSYADLRVIHCNDPSCASYSTYIVDGNNWNFRYFSIAIGTDGYPVISYQSNNLGDSELRYVHCTNIACSTHDNSIVIDDPGDSSGNGAYSSVAVGSDGPVISYYDDNNDKLKAAKYVTSGGGNCNSDDPTHWKCGVIDSGTNVGSDTSFAIGTDGFPVISYLDISNNDLKVTKCDDATCTSKTNSTVDGQTPATDVGHYTSIAIGTDGFPVVSYQDNSNKYLKMAKCGNASCSSGNTLYTVDSDDGYASSIAITPDGYPIISWFSDATNGYYIAVMKPNAEIQPGWGVSGANGDNLTAAAAGSCQNGTSWQDGEWSEGAKLSPTINLGAYKCTELAFVLDTSEAVPGTTYRLRLTDSNGNALSNYYSYPTFSVVSGGDRRYSKEAIMISNGNCSGSSNYNCSDLTSSTSIANSSIAIGTDGNPVISYYDGAVGGLKVYHCTDTSCSAGSAYTLDNVGLTSAIAIGTDGYPVISYYNSSVGILKVYHCTNPICSTGNAYSLDATNFVGTFNSIAIGMDGYPVISYRDETANALKFYKCANTSCSTGSAYTVDDPANNIGIHSSIAIGTDGNPVISYYDFSAGALKVTRQTPGAGSGCTNSDWTCMTVDGPVSATVGDHSSIAIGTDGNPVISYYDFSAGALKVARETPGGGTGCTYSDWTCTTVDDTSQYVGQETSIAIDMVGNPVISYYDVSAGALKVARQTPGAGTGCTDSNWTCTAVSVASHGSIAIGSDGLPVISYNISTTLKIAKALGLPMTATAYFGNHARGDKQIKFKADATSSQFLQAISAVEDGLKYWLDKTGYQSIASEDTVRDPMATTGSNYSPMFSFIDKYGGNNTFPATRWVGKSTVSAGPPDNKNIKLEIFRFGSTNSWVEVDKEDTASCTIDDCILEGSPSAGTASEYYLPRWKYDSQKRRKNAKAEYWVYWRVYQDAGSETLSTNYWPSGGFLRGPLEIKGPWELK